MNLFLLLKALAMGVVEGLTEFLPISSTGHLIIAGVLLDFTGDRAKVFEIFIQSGAMLALVWEYRARFLGLGRGVFTDPKARRFGVNLAVAFLPAAVAGLALGKIIKAHLFKPVPVAIAFLVGGVIILLVERRKTTPRVETVDDMTLTDAIKVGLAQCLALIPGTSRSGATILGGMLSGLSRTAATEFSFFLAVPTLLAAGAYDLLKNRKLLEAGDAPIFAAGTIAAFLSAFVCVRWLIRYVRTHDFKPFAYYRFVFGLAVLGTAYYGLVDWSAG